MSHTLSVYKSIMTARALNSDWLCLSHRLQPGIPTFPGDPEVQVTAHSTVSTAGYAVHSIALGSQSGTHVDTPAHLYTTGTALHEFQPQRFTTSAIILDLRTLAQPAAMIPATVFEQLPPATAQVDTLLVCTGWDTHWGTPAYFQNPHFDAAAAATLLQLGYRTFGCDLPSPDACAGTQLPFHKTYLASPDSLIIENLTGLTQLPHGEIIDFIFLPALLGSPDGSPVSAIARPL